MRNKFVYKEYIHFDCSLRDVACTVVIVILLVAYLKVIVSSLRNSYTIIRHIFSRNKHMSNNTTNSLPNVTCRNTKTNLLHAQMISSSHE